MKQFSDEHVVVAVGLLALRLGRTPMCKDWYAHSCRPCHQVILNRWGTWDGFIEATGLPPISLRPDKSTGYRGGRLGKPFWTDRRLGAAMRKIAASKYRKDIVCASKYERRRRLGWPTMARVRKYGGNGRGCWCRALLRAGIEKVPRKNMPWTKAEESFLLQNAGVLTLKQIGRRLGRSCPACKRRLYDLGFRARDARGWYTGQRLAQELNIPLSRIYAAIHSGRLRATRPRRSPYWQISPGSVELNREWLTRPKRTHKSTPPETVDWYKKNGVKRSANGNVRREVAA